MVNNSRRKEEEEVFLKDRHIGTGEDREAKTQSGQVQALGETNEFSHINAKSMNLLDKAEERLLCRLWQCIGEFLGV